MTGAENTERRVLVCDDQEVSYKKLSAYLKNEGYACAPRVCTTEEIREALRKSHKTRQYYQFVMIDMDLSMGSDPGTNGAQIYNAIRDDYPSETYIIYTTADAEQFRREIGRLMYRDVAFVLLNRLLKEEDLPLELSQVIQKTDPRKVFFVHGRDRDKNRKMRRFLTESLQLSLVEWEDARERVGGSPDNIFEIVMKGIEMSHATVVLFTDDERVELMAKRLRQPGDSDKRTQSRANVYIEAGYARGTRPRRTIFVEWPRPGGTIGVASDFAGIHVVRFDEGKEAREVLKKRLEAARCEVDAKRNWRTAALS